MIQMKTKEQNALLCLIHLYIYQSIFTEGNNFYYFLFAYWGREALSKWGKLLKDTIYSF